MRGLHSTLVALLVAAALSTSALASPLPSPILTARQFNGTPVNGGADALKDPILLDPSQDPSNPTDGGGRGFNVPAILWIVFCGIVGPPVALAAVRGWKLTAGIGIGLSVTILLWASFINTLSSSGLGDTSSTSDLVLDVIVFGGFFLGFACGFWHALTTIGGVLLGGCGGGAVGLLIVLLRPGLIFDPIYFANWVLIAGFLMAGAVYTGFRQRLGVIIGGSSCGSFLTVLGIDLIVNQQSGMSQGLRFLMDQNKEHAQQLSEAGYKPPMSTIILAAVGLVAIPALSYGQHRLFKGPFDRSARSLEEYRIDMGGKPILAFDEEEKLAPGEKPFAPFNVIGTPMRASAAWLSNSWKASRGRPAIAKEANRS